MTTINYWTTAICTELIFRVPVTNIQNFMKIWARSLVLGATLSFNKFLLWMCKRWATDWYNHCNQPCKIIPLTYSSWPSPYLTFQSVSFMCYSPVQVGCKRFTCPCRFWKALSAPKWKPIMNLVDPIYFIPWIYLAFQSCRSHAGAVYWGCPFEISNSRGKSVKNEKSIPMIVQNSDRAIIMKIKIGIGPQSVESESELETKMLNRPITGYTAQKASWHGALSRTVSALCMSISSLHHTCKSHCAYAPLLDMTPFWSGGFL